MEFNLKKLKRIIEEELSVGDILNAPLDLSFYDELKKFTKENHQRSYDIHKEIEVVGDLKKYTVFIKRIR